MLRTKQLGTLSQCTRSFFLSGSRSGTADGSSSYSEDEPCISKKPTKNSVLVPERSAVVSDISSVENEPVSHPSAESTERLISLPDSLSFSGCSLKSEDATAGNANLNDLGHSSMAVTDHLVKVGVATVSILSDMINCRLPVLISSVISTTSQSSVVDSRPLYNTGSSHGKFQLKATASKASSKASFDKESSSNSTENNGHEPTCKKSGLKYSPNLKGSSGKGFLPIYSSEVRNSKQDFQFISGSKFHASYENISWVHSAGDCCSKSSQRPDSVLQDTRKYLIQSTSSPQISAADSRLAGKASRQHSIYDNVKDPELSTSVKYKRISQSVQFGHTVDQVYQILQKMKWGPATEQALAGLCCSFDAYQANQVLKRLQDHSVALSYFCWLKRQPGFKHDGHSYTTMVGILGRAQQFETIKRLLYEMTREGLYPNVVTYNRLIHSYGCANYIDEAVKILYQMQQVGCIPDRVTYCTLIDIHAKAGLLDGAMSMYRRMQEAGLSPDTFTYSVVINCLGKAGNLSAACNVFCEMVSRGCSPNLVTYNSLIALQAKARHYADVLKLFRGMQNAGYCPDRVTYSIVMEALGHCGHLNEAEALFVEMKENGCAPDEPVYGLLVDLWGKAGNVAKARSWYQMMLEMGLRPNVPTCNSLLSAYLRAYLFSEAYNLLKSMMHLGLSPSLQTYTLLLSCCTEMQYHNDSVFCCELMEITGHPAHTFLVSMPAAGPDGQNVRDHTSSFLDLMHGEDRESKRGVMDAVIDFLHKSGLKEEAGSVWEVTAQKNVYPNAVREKNTHYWLINLHVMSDGTAVTALSRTLAWFHRRLLASGVAPARIDIVTGWGRRSRVTGSSLVQHAVWELLDIFGFPFFPQAKNTGCFVGRGEPLNSWLLHPYVERMHLL